MSDMHPADDVLARPPATLEATAFAELLAVHRASPRARATSVGWAWR